MYAARPAWRQPAPSFNARRLGRALLLTCTAVCIAALGAAPPSQAAKKRSKHVDYREVAFAEAQRAGVKSPDLFVRQIAAESGYNTRARSPVGANGIAQIMPGTAKEWRVNPMRPKRALRAAAENMAAYERRFGNFKLALAAYNAGPGAVRHYGGIPPFHETRDYVRKITNRSVPLPGLDGKDVELRAEAKQRAQAARAAAQAQATAAAETAATTETDSGADETATTPTETPPTSIHDALLELLVAQLAETFKPLP